MELRIELMADNISHVVAIGRWDVAGAAKIDPELTAIAASGFPIILDMGQVSYLSSMGIRGIVMSGKALQSKGVKLALLRPTPNVAEVLRTAGLHEWFPICRDVEEARLAVAR